VKIIKWGSVPAIAIAVAFGLQQLPTGEASASTENVRVAHWSQADCDFALGILALDVKLDLGTAAWYTDHQAPDKAASYTSVARQWQRDYDFALGEWCSGTPSGDYKASDVAQMIESFRASGQVHFWWMLWRDPTPEAKEFDLHWGYSYVRLEKLFSIPPSGFRT
jgi:hypothetical protein